MLSLCKHTLSVNLQRVGTRLLGSMLPQLKITDIPIINEPILEYKKNSKERNELFEAIREVERCEEIPIVIGEEELTSSDVQYQVMPHDHQKKIAKFYYADKKMLEHAIKVATEAQKKWDLVPIPERLAIWSKAADMMSKEYRQHLNAATMLGQSKTIIQAEIDSAAELIDFFRINAYFFQEALKYQPISTDPKVTLNSMRFRGVDGFIAAVSPFNFTAIGGNLSYTPALAGNSVLWKPSDTAVLSNWTIFKICRAAGVPPGVVNFVPADGPVFGDTITKSRHLAGINFTGSVPTFNRLWKQVGQNIGAYKNYPKMVGECGGKNYHFIHPSADIPSVVAGTIRSSFEYCGQKCSACSRMYVPESIWSEVKEGLLCERDKITYGDPTNVQNFMGAVIDERAFKRISGYIDHAKSDKCLEIIGGGNYDSSRGYFIEPTIIQTKDPENKLMKEEIFGPILTVYVYKDKDVDKTLRLVESTTPFALTGAIFAQDEEWLKYALDVLKPTAGNFYINDKSTGSVVGQQPFGGGRMSGTNDKAGGPYYTLRWTSPQAIKETFSPQTDITYPYMEK